MGRTRRKAAEVAAQENGSAEVPKMDFASVKRVLLNDVRVANSRAAENNQEASTAYKAIKKEYGVSTDMARLVLKWHLMDEDKRDHQLRSLRGLLVEFGMGLTPDLVDHMEGHNSGGRPSAEVVPLFGAGDPDDQDDGLATTGDED